MTISETYYLDLQFQLRLHTLNGSEFETFVNRLLEKIHSDFKRVRPHGARGDGGNDGFVKGQGLYFQMYAPSEPKTKYPDAAKKMRSNFDRLYQEWNHLEEVREYSFVFNDKFEGTNILLEEEQAKLAQDYPGINFSITFCDEIKKLLSKLKPNELMDLGFNLAEADDSEILDVLLQAAEEQSLKANAHDLRAVINIIKLLDVTSFSQIQNIEFLRLCSICLTFEDKEKDAILLLLEGVDNCNSSHILRFELANLYDAIGKLDIGEKYFEQAVERARGDEYILAENLRHKVNRSLGITEDERSISESNFSDKKNASRYFHFRSLIRYEEDSELAILDLEKSIRIQPLRFVSKVTLLEFKLYNAQESGVLVKNVIEDSLLGLNRFVDKTGGESSLSILIRLNIYKLKANLYFSLNDKENHEKYISLMFEAIFESSLSRTVQNVLVWMLKNSVLHGEILDSITKKISECEIEIDSEVKDCVLLQRLGEGTLREKGVGYFKSLGWDDEVSFSESVLKNDRKSVVKKIQNNVEFGKGFLLSLGGWNDDSKFYLEKLKCNEELRQNIKFHLLCESREYQCAFGMLEEITIEESNIYQLEKYLQVAHNVGAWDIELSILSALEKCIPSGLSNYQLLNKFDALIRAVKFREAFSLGNSILCSTDFLDGFSEAYKKYVFVNTLICVGQIKYVDETALDAAFKIIHSFGGLYGDTDVDFKLVAPIYSESSRFQEAFDVIVKRVRSDGKIKQEHLAGLYFIFSSQLGGWLISHLEQPKIVGKDCIVKLTEDPDFYFMGEESYLDMVSAGSGEKASGFYDKYEGDEVDLSNKYSSIENIRAIEKIFTFEQYLVDYVVRKFQSLVPKGMIPHVQSLETPFSDGKIDVEKLIESIKEVTSVGVDLGDYPKDKIPFAFAVKIYGGFNSAMQNISANENGFVNCSSGMRDSMKMEFSVAEQIVNHKKTFFLDASSAMFLIYSGFFPRFIDSVDNIRVPASVLIAIEKTTADLNEKISSEGVLSATKDGVRFVESSSEVLSKQVNNFSDALKLCESDEVGIVDFSAASRNSGDIDRYLSGEYMDSSYLSLKEDCYIVTDDYLTYELIAGMERTNGGVKRNTSTISIMRVLYKYGRISFREYSDYFSFVASNRFRFLSVSTEDIDKCIVGDGEIKFIDLYGSKKMHLGFVLSEEYGLQAGEAARVVGEVIQKYLYDTSITAEAFAGICIAILEDFQEAVYRKNIIKGFYIKLREGARNFLQNEVSTWNEKQCVQRKLGELSGVVEMLSR